MKAHWNNHFEVSVTDAYEQHEELYKMGFGYRAKTWWYRFYPLDFRIVEFCEVVKKLLELGVELDENLQAEYETQLKKYPDEKARIEQLREEQARRERREKFERDCKNFEIWERAWKYAANVLQTQEDAGTLEQKHILSEQTARERLLSLSCEIAKYDFN